MYENSKSPPHPNPLLIQGEGEFFKNKKNRQRGRVAGVYKTPGDDPFGKLRAGSTFPNLTG